MEIGRERPNSRLIKLTLWLLTLVASIPFFWLIRGAKELDFSMITSYNDGIYLTWIRDTSFFVLSALIISVTSCVTAGFVLAVLEVPFRRLILFLTLVTMLIPITAMAMPLYVLIDQIGLNNNLLGVILASCYFPFGAFLSYLYFSSVLPPDVIGMGRIDGLGDFGIYRYLGLPLAKPLVWVVIFFSFLGLWNGTQLPRVLLTDPAQSILSIGIEGLFGQGSTLIALLMIIPSVLLYFAAQRTIARGIFSGAVKE